MHKRVLKTLLEENQQTRECSKSYLESTFWPYEDSQEMPFVTMYEVAFPNCILFSKFQLYLLAREYIECIDVF